MSETDPSSLYWQLMAMWKATHHGPPPYLYQTHVPPQALAERIINLVSLKQVVAKAKGSGVLEQSVSAALKSAVQSAVNPSEPGDDGTTLPWPHRPGPNPYTYSVAASLMQYSNTLTDQTAIAAINEIMGSIIATPAAVAAP